MKPIIAEQPSREDAPVHAVDIIDEFAAIGDSWMRMVVFVYDGIEYPFTFEAPGVKTEREARDKLFVAGAMAAAQNMFLKTVPLETKH
jgi:hypothetical protein